MRDTTVGKPIRTYDANGNWKDWSTDKLVGERKNYLEGWDCGAGVENLCIDMDGEVWSATCRVGGKLGNIWEDFTVPTDWVKCNRKTCSCGADLFIPKVSPGTSREVLRKTNGMPTEVSKKTDADGAFVGMERTHASTLKQVYWEISRRCNYDCNYCWPWIHNNTDAHKSLSQLMRATQLLEEKFIKGAAVNFIISGGEPTANPAFLDWMRYLNTCGHHISLHSNGSRKPEYYEELINYGDLNLSVHFDFYERDKFVKVVEAVVKKKVEVQNRRVGHLEVKMMMSPKDRQEALLLEGLLKEIPDFSSYCTWSFVPIRGSLENKTAEPTLDAGQEVMEGYTEEDFKLFGIGNN